MMLHLEAERAAARQTERKLEKERRRTQRYYDESHKNMQRYHKIRHLSSERSVPQDTTSVQRVTVKDYDCHVNVRLLANQICCWSDCVSPAVIGQTVYRLLSLVRYQELENCGSSGGARGVRELNNERGDLGSVSDSSANSGFRLVAQTAQS